MPRKLTINDVKNQLQKFNNKILIDEQSFVNGRTYCKFFVDGVEKSIQPYVVLSQYKIIKCIQCDKEFIACKIKTKFCSRSCGSVWNMKNNDNVKLTKSNLFFNHGIKKFKSICKQCGIEYEVQNKRKNKTKFCSKKCKSKNLYNRIKDKFISGSIKACTGRVAPNRGKSHTKEAVLKITSSSLSRCNSFCNVKYKNFVDKNKRIIHLKSSYEIAFVEQFLDVNNLKWEYESQGFLLSSGKYYYPDFYVYDTDKWYEIKGYIGHESVNKFKQFVVDYPNYNIEILTKNELQDKFNVDLSVKSIKEIMKHWRIYE